MAAPTAPTLTTITTEGLKKAGYSTVSSGMGATLLTRAQGEWMEEIKNDIWMVAKKLISLQTTDIVIVNEGQSKYSLPSDFSSFLGDEVILLDGSITGTAQAGAVGSITLAATSTMSESWMLGKDILVTAGAGAGEISQCTAYNTSTMVATITPDFGTAPDNTSAYMVIDINYPLKIAAVWDMYGENYPMDKHRPITFHPIGDEDYGEFLLFQAPDDTYGLKIPYYANLMTLDLAGTLMATLYQRWRNVFTMGVTAKCFEADDDDRANDTLLKYNAAVQLLTMRETYGYDLSSLQAVVIN